jgi:hypothetical protein
MVKTQSPVMAAVGAGRVKTLVRFQNTMNFCDRPREANFLAFYPILIGLRARKSEQNRAVCDSNPIVLQASNSAFGRIPVIRRLSANGKVAHSGRSPAAWRSQIDSPD